MRTRTPLLLLLVPLLLTGCSEQPRPDPGSEPRSGPASTPSARASAPSTSSPSAPPTAPSDGPAQPKAWAEPRDFPERAAVRTVQHLAGSIGPRHATSPSYRRAARWVADRLRRVGYDVHRERFEVPGGTSWGVPVASGRAWNVVAEPPGFDPDRPHVVVGAHLDTVPQAPGAEDNASGVGVLLGVAQVVAERRTRLPVVLVAFGAEEPRGPGDDDHHYGSRHHVSTMSAARRQALRGMVSLDRVGVGDRLPVCSAGPPDQLRSALLAAADRAEVPVVPCEGNRASDHWSFVRAGLPGARLGSTSYAAYHSEQDLPPVVGRAQLRRAGRTVLAWLGRPVT